jgi:hypothetical protein
MAAGPSESEPELNATAAMPPPATATITTDVVTNSSIFIRPRHSSPSR